MERIAKSKLFDLLGVILVVGIAIASGYLTETLAEVTNWGSWARWVPFGLILYWEFGPVHLFDPANWSHE